MHECQLEDSLQQQYAMTGYGIASHVHREPLVRPKGLMKRSCGPQSAVVRHLTTWAAIEKAES